MTSLQDKIKELYYSRTPIKDIAKQLGISEYKIYQVIDGKTLVKRLTRIEVANARKMREEGYSVRQIAQKYKVSTQAIYENLKD